jgi:hypothetical protein
MKKNQEGRVDSKKDKKLSLRKQTLRNLTPADLKGVHGGATNTGGSTIECQTQGGGCGGGGGGHG